MQPCTLSQRQSNNPLSNSNIYFPNTGTEPVLNVRDLPASSNDSVIVGAAVGVAITVVLLTIIIVLFIAYIARRTLRKKQEVSANEIALSHVETNAYFDDTEENEVDPLSNPTYATAGGLCVVVGYLHYLRSISSINSYFRYRCEPSSTSKS